MPRDPADPRIFVSYARSDGEAFARALREKLAALGFSLWHDRQDMAGGRDWWRQITEAIDAVEYLVLVMTPAALARTRSGANGGTQGSRAAASCR